VSCYSAYGLRIQSDLALPEFRERRETPAGHDVAIRLAETEFLFPAASGRGWYTWITREEAILFYQDVGLFHVRGGREVIVTPAPGAEETLIRLYLVGNVMGVLLYQRGLLVLHGSAIERDGGAIAFLGNSGAGKSSVAAALHTCGHNVVADDVVPVETTPGRATVYPAFPQLKLYPAIAGALGYDTETLLWLDHTEEKRGCRVPDRFAERSLPLRAVYILAPGETAEIEPLGPQDAVVELIRHSYPCKLWHAGGAAHFRQCVELAQRLPVCRLRKLEHPSTLRALVALVAEHLDGEDARRQTGTPRPSPDRERRGDASERGFTPLSQAVSR
jgi:hypothetical protein